MSDSNPNVKFLKEQQKSLLVTLGLLVGFALGVFLYSLFSGLGSTGLFTSLEDSLDNKFGPVSDTDALLERMAFEKTTNTDFTVSDLRKISEDLQTFDTAELRKAFQSSGSLPFTSSLHTIQDILCEYLVELSPVAALASIVWFEEYRVENLLPIMARHLAQLDLEESFKLTAGLKQPYRDIVLETMLRELDLTDDVMIKLESFNNAEIVDVIVEQKRKQKIYESINQDPSTAFNLLLTDDVEDSEQADLFSQVLNELIQIEGFDALVRFDPLTNYRKFYAELLVPFLAKDRVGVLNYLEQLSQYQRSGLMYPLMDNWVEVDVENALDAARALTNPSFRSSVYGPLLFAWGRTRPLEVLERLDELPRKHRSSAVFAVIHALGATNPDEILRHLPSLKTIPGAYSLEIERTFVYRWASTFPAQALDWVRENMKPESEQRDRMLNRVLGEYALVQPQKAMDVAISEDPSPTRAELGLAFSVIDSLIRNDQLEEAIGLLERVPKDNRMFAYSDVAEKLVLQDRFTEFDSLSEKVPEVDRVNYFYSVARGLSYTDSSSVLEVVVKIPDASVRSEVAKRILSNEWVIERYFTEEQVETLSSIVAE